MISNINLLYVYGSVFLAVSKYGEVSSQGVAPIVKTKYGSVVGIVKDYHGETVYQYLQIPYAEPPVGDLRFARPRPHTSWNGTFNATTLGPSCIQFLFENDKWLLENTNISEDCLQLNIYVPREINHTKPKTVMVWIHGGGFTGGQGTLIDASYLALHGDVIIVAINYRVGLLGFLSTEDSSSPGNYGLWDQKLAMEWTKDNIEGFGGNPESICIYGESAGGYSVGLHTVSPLNKGLFQRAISESGATLSPRALASGSRQVAEHVARLLNCSTETTTGLVACLRTRSAKDILDSQNSAIHNTFPVATMSFINRLGPVVDGELIPADPVHLLQDSTSDAVSFFNSLDIMAGTNNAEGGLMYFTLIQFQKEYNFNISEGIPVEILCEIVTPAVAKDYYNNDTAMAQRMCANYTVIGASLPEQGRATLGVYADLQFLIPTVRTLLAHSSTQTLGSHSFHYVFSHQPSSPWIQDRPSWLDGANHVDELPFVFGLEAMYPPGHERPEQETKLSQQMMTYWSNFAKSGDPNRPTTPEVLWPEFSTNERQYLNLATPTPVAGRRYHDKRVTFWLTEIERRTHSTSSTVIQACPNSGLLLIVLVAVQFFR